MIQVFIKSNMCVTARFSAAWIHEFSLLLVSNSTQPDSYFGPPKIPDQIKEEQLLKPFVCILSSKLLPSEIDPRLTTEGSKFESRQWVEDKHMTTGDHELCN